MIMCCGLLFVLDFLLNQSDLMIGFDCSLLCCLSELLELETDEWISDFDILGAGSALGRRSGAENAGYHECSD